MNEFKTKRLLDIKYCQYPFHFMSYFRNDFFENRPLLNDSHPQRTVTSLLKVFMTYHINLSNCI